MITAAIVSIITAGCFGFVCYRVGRENALDDFVEHIQIDHVVVCKAGCEGCRRLVKTYWGAE